jgi:hypothetical protein
MRAASKQLLGGPNLASRGIPPIMQRMAALQDPRKTSCRSETCSPIASPSAWPKTHTPTWSSATEPTTEARPATSSPPPSPAWACASLLVAMVVRPQVVMQILRHSQIAVTMNVYSEVTSAETREALKRLGKSLEAE